MGVGTKLIQLRHHRGAMAQIYVCLHRWHRLNLTADPRLSVALLEVRAKSPSTPKVPKFPLSELEGKTERVEILSFDFPFFIFCS